MKTHLKFFATLAATLLLPALAFSADIKPFVVLIPGAGASGSTIAGIPKIIGNQYFGLYQKQLIKAGIHTFVCPQSLDNDTRSLEERAAECVQQIAAEEKAQGQTCTTGAARNAVLVGHSMGGLIARLLAHDDQISGCISSILGLATPNEGTSLADFAIDREDTPGDLIGTILNAINFTPQHNRYLSEMRADHTQDPPATFNSQTIADSPDINYYSISDSFSFNPWPLEVTKDILASLLKKQGLDQTRWGDKNDGIVPEYSQIHGTYLGHLDINHWEMACVDPMKDTIGCHKAAAMVIPAVQKLVQDAASNLEQ